MDKKALLAALVRARAAAPNPTPIRLAFPRSVGAVLSPASPEASRVYTVAQSRTAAAGAPPRSNKDFVADLERVIAAGEAEEVADLERVIAAGVDEEEEEDAYVGGVEESF